MLICTKFQPKISLEMFLYCELTSALAWQTKFLIKPCTCLNYKLLLTQSTNNTTVTLKAIGLWPAQINAVKFEAIRLLNWDSIVFILRLKCLLRRACTISPLSYTQWMFWVLFYVGFHGDAPISLFVSAILCPKRWFEMLLFAPFRETKRVGLPWNGIIAKRSMLSLCIELPWCEPSLLRICCSLKNKLIIIE